MFANRVSSLDIYQRPFSAGNTGRFFAGCDAAPLSNSMLTNSGAFAYNMLNRGAGR